MKDALSTRNTVTLNEVEHCRDVLDLKTLYVKRQQKPLQRLHAGGSLYYLDEAFNMIRSEEAKRPNQKLTDLEKNRLAMKYAELMSDNDVKNGLVESYKIDTEARKRRQDKKKERMEAKLEHLGK